MANAFTEPRLSAAVGRAEERRVSILAREKERFERMVDRSGLAVIGKDASCAPVRTLPPKKLGMEVNGWLVRMSFVREDRRKLREMGWRDVEKKLKSGEQDTRLVHTENHMITAVRELQHIIEGYRLEAEERADAEISPFVEAIRLNLGIYEKGAAATDEDIRTLITELQSLRKKLSAKDGAAKGIVSVGRLEFAIEKFSAMLDNGANRGFAIGGACAILFSVSERLSAWRDGQVARAVSKAIHRLASLRLERDKKLYSQLRHFASSTEAVAGYVLVDRKKYGLLDKVGGMLCELGALQKEIRALERRVTWSPEHESALESAKSSLEGMRAEAMRCPWHDAQQRGSVRKEIRRLERKKSRTAEDDTALAAAKARLGEMKAGAMRMPWHDLEARGALRKTIASLEAKRKRSGLAAGELAPKREAFSKKQSEAMRCLWANAAMYYELKNGDKPKVLQGDYGWLHRHVKEGSIGKASAKLSDMQLFLKSNKPRFLLEELEKMPEPYLEPVLPEFRAAVEAMAAKDFAAARAGFSRASELMGAIVYPRAR